MRSITRIVLIASILLVAFAIALPAVAEKPSSTGNPFPAAIDGMTGSVTGTVYTSGSATTGIGGAYVSIINSANLSQEYFNTTTNAYGQYAFTNVYASYNNIGGYGYNLAGQNVSGGSGLTYMIYANASPFGEGYSSPFGIDSSAAGHSSAATSVVIYTKPLPSISGKSYPPAIDGRIGSVIGRVSAADNPTIGIGGAYISIVSASNKSHEYFNSTSNAFGYYAFTGVNASYNNIGGYGYNTAGQNVTGGSGLIYRIYANASPFGDGYSNPFGIDASAEPTTVDTSVVVYTRPLPAISGNSYPPAVDGRMGSVTGRVTIAGNPTIGIGGAYVSVVSASNTGHEYFNSTSNAFGYYTFTGVNASYNNIGGYGYNTAGQNVTGGSGLIYMIYVRDSLYGDGYSSPFGIDSSAEPSTADTSVVIYTKPARIELNVERSWVAADGSDNIKVTATLYDSLGNPAENGYPINFTIGNRTNNGWMNGFSWTTDNGSIGCNGSQLYIKAIVSGEANAQFGWVPHNMEGGSSTIYAYYGNDPNIFASRNIDFSYTEPPDGLSVSVQKSVLLVGGQPTGVVAQLYRDGQPYRTAGVPVTFYSDNDTVATLPSIHTNTTDSSGSTWIWLTSNDTAGKVNVTGMVSTGSGPTYDTVMVRAIDWGSISGMVLDMNGAPITGATVKLWNVRWNDATNTWENTNLAYSFDNPQLSKSSASGHAGLYVFSRIPYDVYNVTAEKDGHISSSIMVLGPWPGDVSAYMNAWQVPASEYGTATHNLVIPDYAFISPAFSAPEGIQSGSRSMAYDSSQTPPDGLSVSVENSVLLAGGQCTWVVAQLYLNGQPYAAADVPVTFSSDNDMVATLPSVRTNLTDSSGKTCILLTSNTTIGRVNVSAMVTTGSGQYVFSTSMVRVIGWGSVSGMVMDMNGNPIPDANVTLWNVRWNDVTNKWENTNPAYVMGNPRLSRSVPGQEGLYAFTRVPLDVYNVTAEKDGHVYWSLLVLGPWPNGVSDYMNAWEVPSSEYGTATHNIVIPDYAYISQAFSAPNGSPSGTSDGPALAYDGSQAQPDALKLTVTNSVLLEGGQVTGVMAQLYLGGQPYHLSGVPVNFVTDNDMVATLPAVRTNLTDSNGQTWIWLTSNDSVGKVNVTGYLAGDVVMDTSMVRVIGWGTVSGIVLDRNGNAIPNANVTLWNVRWSDAYNRWENVQPAYIFDNPTLSKSVTGQGQYAFTRVPLDVYNVTAEKDGYVSSTIIVLGPWPGDVSEYRNATIIPASEYGTATHNVVIPDYAYIAPVVTPSAGFTANLTSGYAPLSIQFTDTSANVPASWEWNFGDGSANVTDQSPVHTYTQAGTYDVTLTVANSAGSSTLLSAGCVTVLPYTLKVNGTLSVATDATWPPFEFYNTSNGLDGFDIDLMNEIARELNLSVNYSNVPFDTIMPLVENGSYDCSISAWTITPNRQQFVGFSDPYYHAGPGDDYGIIVSKDNPGLLAAINAKLANMKADGSYQVIYNKWFPQDNHTSFTLSLHKGWNLVSSPLVIDPAINVSAFKGTNVTMVARYNKTTGGFDIYRVGKTPTAFPFAEGQGYFLYCNNDTTYMVNGFSETGQSTTISQGWNLIGWTNMTALNSKTLAQGLHNVTMLARYNTTSGGYDIYRVGKTPTPFAVQAGEGYFLYTTYIDPQTLVMG